MKLVVGIGYTKNQSESAANLLCSTHPILTVNRNLPQKAKCNYVYNVYDVENQKYIEEAIIVSETPDEIIQKLLQKYVNEIIKIVVISPKMTPSNPLIKQQLKNVVERTEENFRFIFCLSQFVFPDGPILPESQIVVFTIIGKTGIAWFYKCRETADPFVYCKREKDFQMNHVDQSFIDKTFHVFSLQPENVHVLYNSSVKDEFWNYLFARQNEYKSFQQNQVLNLYEDNLHYRATMYVRYLALDPNICSFIFDKTTSYVQQVYCKDDVKEPMTLPSPNRTLTYLNNAIGIDLGTTQCVLAIALDHGKMTDAISIDESSDLHMPAAIAFVQEPPIVGKIAMRQLHSKSKSVIFDAKRAILPTPVTYQESSPYVKIDTVWPFGVCRSHDEFSFVVDDGKVMNTDTKYQFTSISMTEITSMFLKSIKKAALSSKEKIKNVVITIPYQLEPFHEFHLIKKDIEKAAAEINVNLLGTIRETDANLLYYASKYKLANTMNVLVVDIGGGTGIMRIYYIQPKYFGRFTAKNVGGKRECLYGRLIDQVLLAELMKIMKNYKIDNKDIENQYFKLLNVCQNIKHDLSSEEKTILNLSDFDHNVQVHHVLTRKWFEENIMEKMALYPNSQTPNGMNEFRNKLEGCKSYCEINYVFLAGGTCRIPYIQNTIKQVFSHLDPSRIVIDPEPDIITAKGAMIYASQILEQQEWKREQEAFDASIDEMRERVCYASEPSPRPANAAVSSSNTPYEESWVVKRSDYSSAGISQVLDELKTRPRPLPSKNSEYPTTLKESDDKLKNEIRERIARLSQDFKTKVIKERGPCSKTKISCFLCDSNFDSTFPDSEQLNYDNWSDFVATKKESLKNTFRDFEQALTAETKFS